MRSNSARQLALSAQTVLELGLYPRLRIDLRYPVSPRARRGLRSLGLTGAFAVVTPFNPHGRPAGEAANTVRLEAMRLELLADDLPPLAADGVSPDGSHRERGFALTLGREAAVALAVRWEQLALYWFDGEAFWVLPALARHAPLRLPANDVGAEAAGPAAS